MGTQSGPVLESHRFQGPPASRPEIQLEKVEPPECRPAPKNIVPDGFDLAENRHSAEPCQAELKSQLRSYPLGQGAAPLEKFTRSLNLKGHQMRPASVTGVAAIEQVVFHFFEREVETAEILHREI